MVRGALGVKASRHITRNRLGVFGENVVERLNAGQSFAAMIAPLVTWDGLERQQTRADAWAVASKEFAESNRQWMGIKDAAEQTLNSLVTVAGRLPLGADSEGEQNEWLVRAHEVVAKALPSMHPDLALMTRQRLTRRLELRHFDRDVAAQAASYVIPPVEVEVLI